MATVLYANNAATTLAGTVSSGATSATLASGTGALFPSPTGGDYFVMTFSDAATNTDREIVHVTARSGDTITIVRAQEGTTAQDWAVADNAQNLWTAGSAAVLAQVSQVQIQPGNYAVDSGSVNTVTATLSLAPASYAAITGSAIRIKKAASANAGAVTINLNGLGAVPIVTTSGSALVLNQLPANGIFTVVYDGANFQLQSSIATSRSGEMFYWPASTPPAYALVRNGQAVSRTTYAGLNALAAAASYSDPWGPGNGSTTFNLPNDLGLFERGWDSGGSIDPGRGFGSYQADEVGPLTTNLNVYRPNPAGASVTRLVGNDNGGSSTYSLTTSSGTETRPKNRAYLPCICI